MRKAADPLSDAIKDIENDARASTDARVVDRE
jgi:hypothetical protein